MLISTYFRPNTYHYNPEVLGVKIVRRLGKDQKIVNKGFEHFLGMYLSRGNKEKQVD
jgi:hypothetical protein